MTIRVKMMITLDIDTEEYIASADGKVNDEIEDFKEKHLRFRRC